MPESAFLFSWPMVVSAAILVLIGAYLATTRQMAHRHRTLDRIAVELSARGVVADASFTVNDARHTLLVTANDVIIVDVVRGRVTQQFRHEDVHGLSITEGGGHTAFTLLLNGGAESRMIRSRSIIEFGQLFQLIARQGKQLRFVPEKAV